MWPFTKKVRQSNIKAGGDIAGGDILIIKDPGIQSVTHKSSNGSRVTINGKTTTAPPGVSLQVIGNKIYFDGVLQEEDLKGTVVVKIEGDVMNVESDGNVHIKGQVHGFVKSGMGLTCDNISGDAEAKMGIGCKNIGGNAKAGMGINCGDICGDAKAGMGIRRR